MSQTRGDDGKLHSDDDVGQGWGALRLCWRGYKIAKSQDNVDDMKRYARRIRYHQLMLDIAIMDFPDLGVYGEVPEERPD